MNSYFPLFTLMTYSRKILFCNDNFIKCPFYFLGEETLNKAIEELKFVESEKRENAIAGEQKKIEELQVTIDQLRVVSW